MEQSQKNRDDTNEGEERIERIVWGKRSYEDQNSTFKRDEMKYEPQRKRVKQAFFTDRIYRYQTQKSSFQFNQTADVNQNPSENSCDTPNTTLQSNSIKFRLKSQVQESYEHLQGQHPQIHSLIRLQSKLEDYLVFSKTIRNKLLGQSFKEIKRNLMASFQVSFSVRAFRQILFLKPNFYDISYSHLNDQFPYIIKLPRHANDSNLRKLQFKKAILAYVFDIKRNQRLKGEEPTKIIDIPLYSIKQDSTKQPKQFLHFLHQQKSKLFLVQQKRKINPTDILDQSSHFKQKLYALIKQREMQRQQKFLTQKQQAKEQIVKIDPKQIEKILEETFKIYMAKDVSNMFFVSLVDILSKKKFFFNANKVVSVLKLIQEKCNGFLTILNHDKGKIVKINKFKYTEARRLLGLSDLRRSSQKMRTNEVEISFQKR